MFATIRAGACLFKAVKSVLSKARAKSTQAYKKIQVRAKEKLQLLKRKLKSLVVWFKARKQKSTRLVLIHKQSSNRARNKNIQQRKKRSTNLKYLENKDSHPGKNQYSSTTIQEFYAEWEAGWGPSLNSADREFLESVDAELAIKIMQNGRRVLKSPYLKAVFNGLKDLQEISDLFAFDQQAKEKLLPYLKDYYARRPDTFYQMLCAMHDKGVFETRSGDRRLSLDPRLIPAWIGLDDVG